MLFLFLYLGLRKARPFYCGSTHFCPDRTGGFPCLKTPKNETIKNDSLVFCAPNLSNNLLVKVHYNSAAGSSCRGQRYPVQGGIQMKPNVEAKKCLCR